MAEECSTLVDEVISLSAQLSATGMMIDLPISILILRTSSLITALLFKFGSSSSKLIGINDGMVFLL